MLQALLTATVAAFGIDWLSKAWARDAMPASKAGAWPILSVRNNPTPIFLRLGQGWALLLWAVAATSAALGLALLPSMPLALAVGLGLALGGSAGNLWDGLRHGSVLDFIRIGRWPVFNLGDAAMVCGAMLAMFGLC